MGASFGMAARSGVNLRGDFNVGNTTAFELGVEDEVVVAEEEKEKEEKVDPVGGNEDVEMKDAGGGEQKTEEEEEEGAVKDEMEEGEEKDETDTTDKKVTIPLPTASDGPPPKGSSISAKLLSTVP